MLSNVKTSGKFWQILWPFQKTWTVTEYWLCFYIFEQCCVRQKCWSYCKIWLLKRGLMQQKTWSDFDSLSSYISYPLKRAQELWQLLKMANPLMVNIIISWKKNLEKSKEINIEFFRCFHQFFPRNFLSLSSWKQDALYYFI